MYVATLPCEIRIFKNHYNVNKYIAKTYYSKEFFTNFYIKIILFRFRYMTDVYK